MLDVQGCDVMGEGVRSFPFPSPVAGAAPSSHPVLLLWVSSVLKPNRGASAYRRAARWRFHFSPAYPE